MAYQVLSGLKHPILLPGGRAGVGCVHEAPRRGICKDGTWYTYGWDLTKNICESARQSPRGPGGGLDKCAAFARRARSRGAAPSQHIPRSSAYNDIELGLVYYNYRHDNPADGRWPGRDLMPSTNQYGFIHNSNILAYDYLGLPDPIYGGYLQGTGIANTRTPDITPNIHADAPPVIGNEISLKTAREHYRTKSGRPAGISFDMVDTSSVKEAEQFPAVLKWLREHRSTSGCCVAASVFVDDARLLYSTKEKQFWRLAP